MKEIKVTVTDMQERFLKLFATNHYPGARDNLATDRPLHIVQTKRNRYIPYCGEPDISDYYDYLPVVFSIDGDSEWVTDETVVVREYYHDKTPPIPIKSFCELKWTSVELPDGDHVYITGYDVYFKVYGVPDVNIAWREETYEDVAYFFILEEAQKYLKYQAHNLHEPRTYTVSAGYSNQGEYRHFYDLLIGIGKQLLGKSEATVDRRDGLNATV